jgi:ABC-type transport system substrate-binding protein
MEKKDLIIVLFLIVLIVSGVSFIFIAMNYNAIYGGTTPTSLVRGTSSGPHSLDPVNSWDSASNDVIDQVCEGLFACDLTDLNLPRVCKLAESYFWINLTALQIKLRENVLFHDESYFDAFAAKWNLDRLNYFINASGTLPPSSPLAATTALYYFSSGMPIMNRTVVVTEFTIIVYLNAPFAPFLDLLCYEASYMLSPSSTPEDRFIRLQEDLVGTGPFKFDSFTSGVEVRFSRWDHYWRPISFIRTMSFAIMPSNTDRINAMLGHEIDYLSGPINTWWMPDDTITIKQFTEDTGIPGLDYYYLGFNNHIINETWRRAISHAINYSYIIEEMLGGIRANSPISPGYGQSYNSSTMAPDYDLARAREILKNAHINGTEILLATNETSGPIADAWKSANLFTVNYSYNWDSSFRSDLFIALSFWFDQIGIMLVDDNMSWDDFINKLYNETETLGIFWVSQTTHYLDPYYVLNSLFNPKWNFAQVDDPWLNAQLSLALQTTDDIARQFIYKNIQSHLATQSFPHAFVCHPKLNFIHSADLRGVAYNAMGKFEAYSIYRI